MDGFPFPVHILEPILSMVPRAVLLLRIASWITSFHNILFFFFTEASALVASMISVALSLHHHAQGVRGGLRRVHRGRLRRRHRGRLRRRHRGRLRRRHRGRLRRRHRGRLRRRHRGRLRRRHRGRLRGSAQRPTEEEAQRPTEGSAQRPTEERSTDENARGD